MGALQDGEVYELLVFLLRELLRGLGQMGYDEQDCSHQQDGSQDKVRRLHGVGFRLDVAFPTAGIIGRDGLAGEFLAAENQLAQEHSRYKGSKTVERLCKVEPARGGFLIAKGGNIRIGSSLQEAHSGCYDEEDCQVEGILLHGCSRQEEEASESRQRKAENDTGLVAILLHEHCYGNRENEVSEPVRALREGGGEGVQLAGLHHLPDHRRQEVTAYGPQEE